jgi:putative peptidoglycan lipid II flippase
MSGAQNLSRVSAVMAVGTVASRLTGFLRTAAIAAAVGAVASSHNPLADPYNTANIIPNIVYDLLLGGVLTSVIVPTLVRARQNDDDGGTGYAQTILTLTTVGLVVVTVLAELCAPWIARLYSSDHARTLTFLRWFLPQLLFYGIGAVAGAVLNTRNKFALPMVLPVINNIVVISCAAAYLAMPGSKTSPSRLLVLEAGTTLGVIGMTLPLLPAVRAAGVPLRWKWNLRHPGLRQARSLAGWTVGYVIVTQVGFAVVVHLSSKVKGFSAYSNAYQIFQLPYAIAGVSVVTALLPAMSRHAAAGRLLLLRDTVSRSLRLTGALVVPASILLVLLARPVAVLIFWHGTTTLAQARLVGDVIAIFSVGLVPFTLQQVLLRAFYARQDSRTPFVLGVLVTTVLIASDLVAAQISHTTGLARGLAAGFVAAYTVGAMATAITLRRRLGGRGRRVVRLYVRTGIAGLVAGGLAWSASRGMQAAIPGAGLADAFGQLAVAGVLGLGGYFVMARLLRIREVEPLRGLLGRVVARATPAA